MDGRVAVVTGSARGIGKGIAARFAEEGARVLLVDIRADDLEAALEDMSAEHCAMLAIDLTDRAAPERVRAAANEAFGKIDILVNNAGVGIGGQIEDFSDEQWDRTIAINLTAPFRLSRSIVPQMADAGYGRVINISSMNAQIGMRQDTAYAATKAGLEALTRSISVDYGPRGVTANTIAPGTIETPLNSDILSTWGDESALKQIVLINKPVPGNGAVEDIAAAATYLASEESRYVSAQCLAVDGGLCGTRFVPDPKGETPRRYVEHD
ncbi:short chain dehydrogenase family protein 19 [Sphingobium sp. MI1205]|nr:short chain dehydrogenase family protein 19 [Sphingobium sp. MI1205]